MSAGFFGLTLLTCNDRLASGLGLIVGAPLAFFDFVWAGLPAWYIVLSMERRPTNWRARRKLLIVSMLPFVFILLGWLVLWVVPKMK
jgi:H+/Cl- antiporter ClcA